MKKDSAKRNSIILLRGLPGSGKSTLAELLSEKGKYPVHSIDSFFTNERNEYHFEFDKNHIAYSECEAQTRKSMQEGKEKIFVDNTFTLEWELDLYLKLAAEFDYNVFVVTVENRHGSENIHQISEEQLKKMAAKYKVQLM
jgi:predicted kinase